MHRARLVARALIDEKGELNKERIDSLLDLLTEQGHVFYPLGTNDSLITEHLIRMLHILKQEPIQKTLKKFQAPVVHKWAERLIIETLGSAVVITNGTIRTAVLSALFTPLRQNVGSCFATAPAILIQSEQVPLFLDDLHQLLMTGKLKKILGGVEYALPMSPSTGMGDLKKNLISSDVKARAGFCPGLIYALELAELLDPKRPLEEKAQAVQSFIEELSKGKQRLSAEELIRRTLLRKFSLKEEDLEKKQGLDTARLRLSSGIVHPSHTRSFDRLSAFHQKEKECRAAFKGFCDNALLKAWEFTLASFSEVNKEFSRWNLFISLGISSEEEGGIGAVIVRSIEEKLSLLNKKIEELHIQYENAFHQAKATEKLLKEAYSESEIRRLSIEYQGHSYHLRACLELRDEGHQKAGYYAQLLQFLAEQYQAQFPEYFQEIYDAEMQEMKAELYDDSPAGFRLVYKHGRADPALWTLIENSHQYIDALVDFFLMTQTPIAASCTWEGGEEAIFEITSLVIAHIRSDTFLQSAMQRMTKAHHRFSASGEKKPWAYTSGGTITTLLTTYYAQEKPLTKEERRVENETELLIFIIDTLKNLAPHVTDPYLAQPKKGMLMTSPTHAFILLPGQEQLTKGWQETLFTYTWVRDEVILPSQRFYAGMQISPSEQQFLLSEFCQQLPPILSHCLGSDALHSTPVSIHFWRDTLLNAMQRHSGAHHPLQSRAFADGLDAFLYQNLPLIDGFQWKTLARRILSDKLSEGFEAILATLPDEPAPYLTAKQLQNIIKASYCQAENTLFLPFDIHEFVGKHARFVGAAPPSPLLFADSNWSGNYFGFIVNPGTTQLELWRLDLPLSQGVPMSQWRHCFDPAKGETWAVFTQPYEYGGGLSP